MFKYIKFDVFVWCTVLFVYVQQTDIKILEILIGMGCACGILKSVS